MPPPRALVHSLQLPELRADGRGAPFRGLSPEGFLLGATRMLASHESWASCPDATFVVRGGTTPALALVGYFDDSASARFSALTSALDRSLARHRHVTYEEAERDCVALASSLRSRYGDDVRSFRFVPIPRGGHVVLGMLAYALGLPPEAFGPPDPTRPVVVVDDCSLTGHRFAEFLERVSGDRVVFAHLYSHPALRDAIEAQEDRVDACVSACDLDDWGFDEHGAAYGAWQATWRERTQDRRYWIGSPDHVTFAWKEPDLSLWNEVTRALEPSWRLLPAQLCLSNRHVAEPRIPVQVQPVAAGPVRPLEDVLYGTVGDALIVGSAATGRAFRLEGTAAAMWLALVAEGSLVAAAARLARRYEASEHAILHDLTELAAQLARNQLLDLDSVGVSA